MLAVRTPMTAPFDGGFRLSDSVSKFESLSGRRYTCKYIGLSSSATQERIFRSQQGQKRGLKELIEKVDSEPCKASPAPSPCLSPSILTARESACVVCFTTVHGGHTVQSLQCGHSVHNECVSPWLQGKENACPACADSILSAETPTSVSSKRKGNFGRHTETRSNNGSAFNEEEGEHLSQSALSVCSMIPRSVYVLVGEQLSESGGESYTVPLRHDHPDQNPSDEPSVIVTPTRASAGAGVGYCPSEVGTDDSYEFVTGGSTRSSLSAVI